jgi:hypothetical protein
MAFLIQVSNLNGKMQGIKLVVVRKVHPFGPYGHKAVAVKSWRARIY